MISEQVGYPKISHYPYREKLMMVQRSFAHYGREAKLEPYYAPKFPIYDAAGGVLGTFFMLKSSVLSLSVIFLII